MNNVAMTKTHKSGTRAKFNGAAPDPQLSTNLVTIDKLVSAKEAQALRADATRLLDGHDTGKGGGATAPFPTADPTDAAQKDGASAATRGAPVWCFPHRTVLEKTLEQAGTTVEKVFGVASDEIDTKVLSKESESRCLTREASAKLSAAKLIKYSRTHNVYRGQSALLDSIEERVEGALGLSTAHGAKWQITSYDHNEGYGNHTDCVVGKDLKSFERVATLLQRHLRRGYFGGRWRACET